MVKPISFLYPPIPVELIVFFFTQQMIGLREELPWIHNNRKLHTHTHTQMHIHAELGWPNKKATDVKIDAGKWMSMDFHLPLSLFIHNKYILKFTRYCIFVVSMNPNVSSTVASNNSHSSQTPISARCSNNTNATSFDFSSMGFQ